MKIITVQKIGYNHPSQANWSYEIFTIGTIDTDKGYNMSYTVKSAFGGDSRLANALRNINIEPCHLKGVLECPKITGVSKMLDVESKEMLEIIKDFLK